MKILILLVIISSLTSCFDIKGDTVAFIYPDEGIAKVRQFANACPVKVTKPTTVALSELDGWVCIPPERATKYRQEYEKDCE